MLEITTIIVFGFLNLGIILFLNNREKKKREQFMERAGKLVNDYTDDMRELNDYFTQRVMLKIMEQNMSVEEK